MIFRLAHASLKSRWLTVGLTVLSIAFSTMLYLGVEKIRTGARESFADTISNTDLIMGARSGSIQLMLYSVFRIGNATNNITWESYEDIASDERVEWIVPISLGDSHHNFRVMGTTSDFFKYYQYRGGKALELNEGELHGDLYDTVIGADVAQSLGYQIGSPIVVSHGLASFIEHDDQPFKVAGILKKTGTAVDRTIITSLEAIEAIHLDWQSGAKSQNTTPIDAIRQMDLEPEAITAAFIGTKSRMQIFALQRKINDYREEPLLAILPGVALQELWGIVGVAETALIAVSAMVVVVSLLGMMVMIFASLNERRREMAIWRSVGASPNIIMSLLVLEAMLMALIGVILGVAFLYAGLFLLRPMIDAQFNIWLPMTLPSLREIMVLLIVVLGAGIASLLPALRAYKLSIADGMTVKS